VASVEAKGFYAQLAQPAWAPPASVFGPVWTVLYALMGISAWLVWRQPGAMSSRQVLVLFVVQLAVNALWSWLFFAWHLGAAALAEICLLVVLIVATIRGFWRVRPLAGALLLPYLAWVCFATVLTWALWRGNPGLL
jgi:tryptophan-rich sensory protein